MVIVLAVFDGIVPTGRRQVDGRWSTVAGPGDRLRTSVSAERLPLSTGRLRPARGVAVGRGRLMRSPLSGAGRLAVGVEQAAARVARVAGRVRRRSDVTRWWMFRRRWKIKYWLFAGQLVCGGVHYNTVHNAQLSLSQ